MKIILIFSLFFLINSVKHPFYLTVCDLKYNASEKSFQTSLKVFTNDFEKTLSKITNKTVDLIHPNDSIYTAKLITKYIENHFKITINDAPMAFQYLGYELEQEAIWIYLEFKNCNYPKKISIVNTLLYDFSREQTNIVNIDVNGVSKNLKLSYPDSKLELQF